MKWPTRAPSVRIPAQLNILSWIDPRTWRSAFRLRRRREQTKYMAPPFRWQ